MNRGLINEREECLCTSLTNDVNCDYDTTLITVLIMTLNSSPNPYS
jgi:hypothetical protein